MSYDSDTVWINNPASSNCLDVKNITIADSPYDIDDDALIVDASGGTVVINLTNSNTCNSPSYYIKTTQGEAVINPPAGEQINGLASYSLTNPPNAIQVVRNPNVIPPNWEIITSEISSIPTNKGDLISRTAVTVERLPVGSPGQLLSVDLTTPTGLKWVTSSTSSSIASYHIVNGTISVIGVDWLNVGNFAWSSLRYASYTGGIFVFYAKIYGDKHLDVRLYNNGNVLGGVYAITTNGIYTLTLNSLPVANSVIELQVKRAVGVSNDPEILGGQLEFQI